MKADKTRWSIVLNVDMSVIGTRLVHLISGVFSFPKQDRKELFPKPLTNRLMKINEWLEQGIWNVYISNFVPLLVDGHRKNGPYNPPNLSLSICTCTSLTIVKCLTYSSLTSLAEINRSARNESPSNKKARRLSRASILLDAPAVCGSLSR